MRSRKRRVHDEGHLVKPVTMRLYDPENTPAQVGTGSDAATHGSRLRQGSTRHYPYYHTGGHAQLGSDSASCRGCHDAGPFNPNPARPDAYAQRTAYGGTFTKAYCNFATSHVYPGTDARPDCGGASGHPDGSTHGYTEPCAYSPTHVDTHLNACAHAYSDTYVGGNSGASHVNAHRDVCAHPHSRTQPNTGAQTSRGPGSVGRFLSCYRRA